MDRRQIYYLVITGAVLVLLGAGCSPVYQAENTNSGQTVPAPAQQPVDKATSVVKEFTMTAKNWQFSPATITVHTGDKVRLKITSLDVTHGFALPDYNIKADLAPGVEQTIEFVADKSGTFPFHCSVFCGAGHREMVGSLVVQ